MLAAVESYAGKDPAIDMVIKHKADILKLVTGLTGVGARAYRAGES